MTPGAVSTIWILSLALGLVVLVVVTLLLELIRRGAREVEKTVGDIWIAGQGVANNTIHIALLHRTNVTAARILDSAKGILGAVRMIREHAQRCSHCPSCAGGDRP
jgi:hypothetical protein